MNCSTSEGNVKWETISNGKTIYGQCVNGYQGFATRSCIQYGSTFSWTPISGSCEGILSFSWFFEEKSINKTKTKLKRC